MQLLILIVQTVSDIVGIHQICPPGAYSGLHLTMDAGTIPTELRQLTGLMELSLDGNSIVTG